MPNSPIYISKILHPQIYQDGYFCPCYYKAKFFFPWRVKDIIENIYSLFVNVDFNYFECYRTFNAGFCNYEGDLL